MDEDERGWTNSSHKPFQGNAVALLDHLPKVRKELTVDVPRGAGTC